MLLLNSTSLLTINEDETMDFPMPSLTSQDLDDVAGLFLVAQDRIDVLPHPLDPSRTLIAIRFLRGINVAPALASYLNGEFYYVPKDIDDLRLPYRQNFYAFVDERQYGRTLCLTLLPDKAAFIVGLQKKTKDIHYVMDHPEILFMMRPDIDYLTARTNFQQGFRPSL
jgi:hypothetical protein